MQSAYRMIHWVGRFGDIPSKSIAMLNSKIFLGILDISISKTTLKHFNINDSFIMFLSPPQYILSFMRVYTGHCYICDRKVIADPLFLESFVLLW